MSDQSKAEAALADEFIDTFGMLCPLPVLKARKRLGGMAQGQVLRVLASDPAAIVDIPHFCAQSGHAFVGTEQGENGGQIYVIRKG